MYNCLVNSLNNGRNRLPDQPAGSVAHTGGLGELALHERPQERLEANGPEALSDSELLALLLRKGSVGKDVLELSRELLREAGSPAGLLRLDLPALLAFNGIGRVKAGQLLAVLELARRIHSEHPEVQPLLDTPPKVFQFLRARALGLEIEKFWVLCLNRKNRLLQARAVSSGTATASLVHPREVFREAIRAAATAVICAHNHPSGDPAPSSADIAVTRQLRQAALAVQIELLDHIVIGQPDHDPRGLGFYSFAEAGLL
jgi:DNA repair protein RadC